ncbi:putative lipoprotein [Methylomonas paludis]|uniref:Lipoprotein n=1 Tax=Methylomonas paludis TaxID=1173101 RepID=A0A975R8V3_9GAMM|nr:putative lipoprotein [Methylomonas paludis]QWF69559.1 putative lipoprotein [Methylomonas paludis]
MNTKLSAILPVSLLALSLSACSFSTSSESSSYSANKILDVASSPFKSSSDSSRTEQEKFETDVADYTAEFATGSTGTLDQFRAHLSQLAQSHGISNWEADRTTYVGIGRGLKKAKLGGGQISAFTESLSNNDPLKKQAIEDGLKK